MRPRLSRIIVSAAIAAQLSLAIGKPVHAQVSSAASLDDIEILVKDGRPTENILALARSRCIDFVVGSDAETGLRQAGATQSLIDGLRTVCSSAKPLAPDSAAIARPAVDTGVSVKITAGVLAADQLTRKPLALLDFEVLGPGNSDTSRFRANFDGVSTHTFKHGDYQLRAHKVIVNPNDSTDYTWSIPFTVPGNTELTVSNLNAKAAVVHPIVHIPPERAVHEYARNGVFSVTGINERVGAFLADSSGLLVTSAHPWTSMTRLPIDEPSVTIDSATTVRARIVALDTADGNDVAFLAINMGRCKQCRPLKLADSARSPIVSVQDKVLSETVPSTRVPTGYSASLVSRVERSTITTTETTSTCDAGNPLLAMDSIVVGVSTCRPGSGASAASAVAVTAVLPMLRSSEAAVRSGKIQPSDSLMWMYPRAAFPVESFSVYASAGNFDRGKYMFDAGPWRVFVMTPPVAAWREHQAADEVAKRHDGSTLVDPIQGWHGWQDFLTQRRAAVIINVIPEELNFPHYNLGEVETSPRSFVQMRLLREDAEVVPIEESRVDAALNADDYKREGKTMPIQGVNVYRDRDFAPLAPGHNPAMMIEIIDSSGRPPVRIAIPQDIVVRIQGDFAPYRMGPSGE